VTAGGPAERSPIVVVAAVIERDDSFLLTRRQKGVHLEGLWEFPGGKVDGDETHHDAIRREIREELNANVEPGSLVLHTNHDYPDRSIALYFYRCRLDTAPRPQLGQEMRWVPRQELASLGFPAADEELIRILEARRS
jgi:mutator protein MutT